MSKADALKLAADQARGEKAEIAKLKLAVKLKGAEERIKTARERCAERVDACDQQNATLSFRLSEAGRVEPVVEWYTQPWFVATVTIIVTAAIAVPVTWLAVTESQGTP
jgi:hypothetical protein